VTIFYHVITSYLITSRFKRVVTFETYSRLVSASNLWWEVHSARSSSHAQWLLFLSPYLTLNELCNLPEEYLCIFNADVEEATEKLQRAANNLNTWNRQRLIKSTHVNFTNRRCHHIPIIMSGKTIPHSQTAIYLGMTLDAKLRWEVHVKKKREELGLKYKQMYCLMGRRSALSTHNKLALYKQILMPVWTYGIQLWGRIKSFELVTWKINPEHRTV